MKFYPSDKLKLFIIPAMLMAGFLAGCDKNRIFEEFKEIPEYKWDKKDTIGFETEIKDTNLAYNMILNVRNGENYPYRNLFLFLHTGYPDGRIAQDTLEFYFYEEAGRPLGKCSGDICNNSFLLSENVRFDQAGNYSFKFVHGMRREDGILPYIMNLGLRIEKSTGTEE